MSCQLCGGDDYTSRCDRIMCEGTVCLRCNHETDCPDCSMPNEILCIDCIPIGCNDCGQQICSRHKITCVDCGRNSCLDCAANSTDWLVYDGPGMMSDKIWFCGDCHDKAIDYVRYWRGEPCSICLKHPDEHFMSVCNYSLKEAMEYDSDLDRMIITTILCLQATLPQPAIDSIISNLLNDWKYNEAIEERMNCLRYTIDYLR